MEGLITYRLASENDIEAINALYNRIYKNNRTTEKFNWEYNSAPAGKAIYVIAVTGNKVIGTQCAIPYYLVDHNSNLILSAKSEDTLVDPAFRGKNIFENMYGLLISESRKANIRLIWGFTYAVKPFKKLGFEIPFQSQLGLLVLKPFRAFSYYAGLAEKNSFTRTLKIAALCMKSYGDFLLLKLRGTGHPPVISQQRASLNRNDFNYINDPGLYGLHLDEAFLNYRLYSNPYSKNYFQHSTYENGTLISSAFYTINNGLGYILHIYTSEKNATPKTESFLKTLILTTELKNCYTVRFWGFDHNETARQEIAILKRLKFTFLKRGISFVALSLSDNPELKPERFVLSRLASQGTD